MDPRRRHPHADGGPLAGRHRGSRRAAQSTRPRDRPRPHTHGTRRRGNAGHHRRAQSASLAWPELSTAIRETGISDFTIYLDEETNTLFSVQKLAPDHTAAKLRETEIMRKWWAHMAPLMDTNPDNSPVRTPLKEVFHQH